MGSAIATGAVSPGTRAPTTASVLSCSRTCRGSISSGATTGGLGAATASASYHGSSRARPCAWARAGYPPIRRAPSFRPAHSRAGLGFYAGSPSRAPTGTGTYQGTEPSSTRTGCRTVSVSRRCTATSLISYERSATRSISGGNSPVATTTGPLTRQEKDFPIGARRDPSVAGAAAAVTVAPTDDAGSSACGAR